MYTDLVASFEQVVRWELEAILAEDAHTARIARLNANSWVGAMNMTLYR